jgi:IS4 transposase
MGYRIRQVEAESQFCETITLDAITQHVPVETIHQVVAECQVVEERKRKLPAWLVVLLCITMNLYCQVSLSYVLVRLVQGLRLLHGVGVEEVAGKGAISTARYRLGARPLALLFQRVCRPLATPDTPGAFQFGLRLVALDGTTEMLPDTPDNDAYFGRQKGSRGDSAFPQVRCVYLCECGTHAIFDAGFWPYHRHELIGGHRLLRSVEADMLVMWDRGFHDFDMLMGVVRRGGQVLSRLPDHVKPERVATLPDGSWLGLIYPSGYQRRKQGERLLVRIIEYTIDDPNQPGHGQHYRLVTTLLDPVVYPVHKLACLYHERWEVEIAIDEIDTHQRLVNRPLRSLKPVGVIQELYALLLAHFVVRAIMHEAALAHDLDPDRLSFVNALRLICDAIAEFQLIDPADHHRLWSRLLHDIAQFQLPERENRANPRVVKRKMSNFKLKRPEHWKPPKPTRSFCDAVVLLAEPLHARSLI